MTREEFRANLYKSYVELGMTHHTLIQENIKIAEAFIFDGIALTPEDQESFFDRFSS